MTFRNTIAHANRLNGAYWQPLWAVTILLSVQTAIACPPARVVTRPDILVPTTDAVLEIIPAVHLLQRIRQETWLAHVGPEAYSLVQRLNPPQRQTVSPRGGRWQHKPLLGRRILHTHSNAGQSLVEAGSGKNTIRYIRQNMESRRFLLFRQASGV